MTTDSSLEHCTLEGETEKHTLTLDQAQLTDQQRLAVLLQAAALLAHLDHGRLILSQDWQRLKITTDGELKVDGVQLGRTGELPQVILRRLLQQLFRTEGTVEGRGEARRAARYLYQRWLTTLIPIQLELAVLDILESAPFLWQPTFGPARRALVGKHIVGDKTRLWLIAPGHIRKRLLKRGERLELEALLASPDARLRWFEGDADQDPEDLMQRGLWRRALHAWQARAPHKSKQTVEVARCLYALGRYSQVIETLSGNSRREARIFRAWCRYRLGDNGAAWNQVKKLEALDLSASQTLDVTFLALRLAAARGQDEEGRDWVQRSLACCKGVQRLEALLAAAEAAWDRQAYDKVAQHLEAAREALEHPELAWRWHQVRGLYAIAKEAGDQAVEHLTLALGARRRLLPLADAAGLWNDLAVARSYLDDAPAVERACRQAFLLYNRCEGPRVRTLALCNLAEARLRRGRLEGVEDVLESVTRENRRTGNIRGQIRDLELAIRLELVRGRLRAALTLYEETLSKFGSHLGDRLEIFRILAARAYGWLDRRQEARQCLIQPCPETEEHQPSPTLLQALRELDPEERPALWAHAGLWHQARLEAVGTPWEPLWNNLAHGDNPSSDAWLGLSTLEPFRASRLIFDVENLQPGAVPPGRLRQAVEVLRRAGANRLADLVDLSSAQLWQALEHYLERPELHQTDIAELLYRCGYPEVELIWTRGDHCQSLVSGQGGKAELAARCHGGKLRLRAPFIDPALKTLFCLIRRDIKKPSDSTLSGSMLSDAISNRPPVRSQTGIIGESKTLKQAIERLDRLSQGDLPVLLLGESGSGKELFARRVHQQSTRRDHPYLVVNCAALSESLILSDLFGHVRGAFTGADKDHKGVFEAARGGTLFLDEIGDLPASAQGKLLRVLQEREIRRVGESFTRKVDVRVVAATHRDLEHMVRDDTFRQDLFFRLKVATVRLPPLRERGEDVLQLAEYFLAQRSQKSPRPSIRLSQNAEKRLRSHRWPGNIRELRNVLEVAATLAPQEVIEPEHLDLPASETDDFGDYHRKVKEYRRKLLVGALQQADSRRAEAARILGLTRQALSYLIRELDIDI